MKEFTITSPSDGLALAVAVCEPAGSPSGIVQIAHGMCEHKERYYDFMEFLAENGFVAICNDHRGHGASVRSVQDLGYMYKGGWKAMVDDCKTVTDWARNNFPGIPLTLFGHSMGSMVVRSYTKRYDDAIDALFVCGCPSDNPAKGAGKAIAAVTECLRGDHHRPKLLQDMSFGAYNKPFKDEGYSAAWVCSDKGTLDAYHSDPLCTYIFTANGFRNLMGLMQDCYSKEGWKMSNKTLPVHFISGGDDPCRISDGALANAVEAMRKAGYPSTDLKIYPGMRHEILNETGKAQVWNDVLSLLPHN